ncbi:MAG TPA: glutathione S-transferase family protein [Polyangiales bacterium]|nr:glutathione S-transferase family protein [Polyangiales bacterium]
MPLKFYYAPMSTASITALVLEELGVDCEIIKVDIARGDTKKPEFLQVNPNGRVPVLIHDDAVIWESAAITMYLGEMFGVDKKLYPPPGPKRAEAMKWIVWTNVTLGEAVNRFTRNALSTTPADQKTAKAVESAKTEVANCLRILDQALLNKQYLVGEYTLADTHLTAMLDYLRHLKIDFTPYARINSWSQRCSARAAYQRAMTAEVER